MLETKRFVIFWGDYLSQWYSSRFIEDSKQFHCSEQYMMYHKALLFGDTKIASEIMKALTPKEQKSLGRKVKGFDAAKWNAVARDIVYQGNWLKFSQNEQIRDKLLLTGDKVIVEGSPYDRIWGIGLHFSDADAQEPRKWNGTNWLGHCLIAVRNNLRAQKQGEEPTKPDWSYFDFGLYLR